MSASINERLHEYLHKLPGMPSHSEADRLNQNRHAHNHRGGRRPSLSSPNGHHARPPRVLVAWQKWIEGLFTGRGGH
ncbi:hypothetical protein JOF56_008711 [Kibdelosporangium banguiense]|uniref:DUF3040 domain-containing protein n=1 Tax=Kibdelosporangium banguiense TaxID=1365924 RepID=A0ABS4TV87_9PSEU|nr:hypothetical protein [Kibdelosporangium banguiense]MBP2328326.1 hypothetical protein [Kibdelosporangium banguiense]